MKTPPRSQRKWAIGAAVFGAAWAFYALAILLKTGYTSDDAYNSQVSGTLIYDGKSIGEFVWKEIVDWTRGPGRFFPLAFYSYPLFHFITSRLVYKLIVIGVSMANIGLFAYWLKQVTGSRAFALFSVFCVPVFFQFRAWHDPFLAFAFLVPIVTFYFFSSLTLFQCYLSSRKTAILALSVFFHLCALLTYEMSYLCIFCHAYVAWYHEKNLRGAIRSALPHVGVWALVVSITVALKSPLNPSFHGDYPGANLNLDLPQIVQAFMIQTYSAFPLSYYWRVKTHIRQYLFNWDFLVLGTFFLLVFYFLRSALRERAQNAWRFLVGFGFFLVTGPAWVMAVSGHQKTIIEAGYGYGYLAVYLQYFGAFSLMAGLLLKGCAQIKNIRVRGGFEALVAMTLAVIAAYNVGQNRSVALESAKTFLYPRQIMDDALSRGLLAHLPEDAVLLRRFVYPHDHYWNFAKWVGHKLDIQEPEPFLGKISAGVKKGEVLETFDRPVFAFAYSFDGSRYGVAYLARLNHLAFNHKTNRIARFGVNKLRVYDSSSRRLYWISLPPGQEMEFTPYLERSILPPLQVSDLKAEPYLSPSHEGDSW